MNHVDEFLAQYISPPKGTGPNALAQRVTYWIRIANAPKDFYPNADAFELRTRRKAARQNARRLLERHPELIPEVTRLLNDAKSPFGSTVVQ